MVINSTFSKILIKKRVGIDYGLKDYGYITHMHQSRNGQYIILAFSEMVIILRSSDLQLVFAEEFPYACFAEFSKDEQYILIGTWSSGYVIENTLK